MPTRLSILILFFNSLIKWCCCNNFDVANSLLSTKPTTAKTTVIPTKMMVVKTIYVLAIDIASEVVFTCTDFSQPTNHGAIVPSANPAKISAKVLYNFLTLC